MTKHDPDLMARGDYKRVREAREATADVADCGLETGSTGHCAASLRLERRRAKARLEKCCGKPQHYTLGRDFTETSAKGLAESEFGAPLGTQQDAA